MSSKKIERKVFAKDVKATTEEIAKTAKPVVDAYFKYITENPYVDKDEEKKNNCVNCGTVLRHEIRAFCVPLDSDDSCRIPNIQVEKKCPKCYPIAEEKVEAIVEDESKDEAIVEDEPKVETSNNGYVAMALDGIHAAAGQINFDIGNQDVDETAKKSSIDEAIRSLETTFRHWKSGRVAPNTWESAIYLVDMMIDVAILHEKLHEIEYPGKTFLEVHNAFKAGKSRQEILKGE